MTNVLGRGLSVFINWHSVEYTFESDVDKKDLTNVFFRVLILHLED